MRIRLLFLGAPLLLALASPALAQDATEKARTHFSRGVELYKESDYRAAIIEFQRAYQLAPNYRILYNLAQAQLELLDWAAALQTFERYLAEGGSEVPADRRALAEKEIARLRGRVSDLTVTSAVDGATVSVDDAVVGTTPLAKGVMVSAGRRRVQLSKPGYTTVTRTLDVAGGDRVSVSIDLSKEKAITGASAAPARHRDAPVATPKDEGMGAPFWIGVVTTGLLAAGAGVVGGLALAANSDHEDEVDRVGVTEAELEDSRSKVMSLAIAFDILAGSALVATGVTIAIGVSSSSSPPPRATGGRRTMAISVGGAF